MAHVAVACFAVCGESLSAVDWGVAALAAGVLKFVFQYFQFHFTNHYGNAHQKLQYNTPAVQYNSPGVPRQYTGCATTDHRMRNYRSPDVQPQITRCETTYHRMHNYRMLDAPLLPKFFFPPPKFMSMSKVDRNNLPPH